MLDSVRSWKIITVAAVWCAAASAQPLAYTISTTAGGSTAFTFAEGKPATSFLIPNFVQPAADGQGKLLLQHGLTNPGNLLLDPQGRLLIFDTYGVGAATTASAGWT